MNRLIAWFRTRREAKRLRAEREELARSIRAMSYEDYRIAIGERDPYLNFYGSHGP